MSVGHEMQSLTLNPDLGQQAPTGAGSMPVALLLALLAAR
jgi:hypothetical protein